jgi:hypothetical protein
MARILAATVIVAGCAAAPARIDTATPAPPPVTAMVNPHGWVVCNRQNPDPCVIVTTTTVDPVAVIPPLLRAIGGCESSGDPRGPLVWTAHNRASSASGAFEELDGTWQTWEAKWGSEHVLRAMWADEAEQVRVAVAAFDAEGSAPWSASEGCWAA